jgi:predicted phosphoribosyltransferase
MRRLLRDRVEAGQLLAAQLQPYAHRQDTVVLALPRGGVPVAFEVASVLHLPLDVCLVRKLGVPRHPELAMGAIAPGGICVLNEGVLHDARVSQAELSRVTALEQTELERRDRLYRANRPPLWVAGQTVILVDDGIATGSTIQAAIATLKQQQPAQIIVATPVASPLVCQALKQEVDEVVCLLQPHPLSSISVWYQDFSQTPDDEVIRLLDQARQPAALS